jgi:hypothetical protein
MSKPDNKSNKMSMNAKQVTLANEQDLFVTLVGTSMDGRTGSTNMSNELLPAGVNVCHTALMVKSSLLAVLDDAMECLLGVTDALVPQSVEGIVYSINEQCHTHHVAGIIK